MLQTKKRAAGLCRNYFITALIAWAFDSGGMYSFAATATGDVATVEANDSLTEIVVTAEKRSENLQKIPLSLTSLSGEDLAATGTVNIGDLQNVVPNLEVLAGSANTELAIRGVDPLAPVPANDPVVGFNVDGVPEARPAGANGVFYDISRVEVLEGPQGTLYGRNTTAGVINVITNRPTDTFEASGEIGSGDYGRVHSAGMMNVPISPELAIRAAFDTEKHDPYMNTGLTPGNMDADERAGRIHVLYTPSEDVSLLVSGDYYRRTGAGNNEIDLTNIRTTANPWTFIYPTNSRGTFDPSVDAQNTGFSAELNWTLPIALLTNILGHRSVSDDESNFTAGKQGTLSTNSQELTEELRLSSLPGDGPKWIVGTFYSAEHQHAATEKFDQNGPGSTVSVYDNRIDTKSVAAFGDLTYNLLDSLRLLSGVRYTRDSKNGDGALVAVTPGLATDSLPFNANLISSAVNWKLGLQKDVAAQSMLYFTASTGYKAGGFYEIPSYTLNNLPNTFQPEHNLAFELGSKNRFLNDRLQFNGDVFHYSYTDYQTQAPGKVFLPGGASAVLLATFNAGAVNIFGVETNLEYKLTPHDRIGLDVNYLEAKFGNFSVPSFIVANKAVFGITSLYGIKVPDAPTMAGNISYVHDWPISSAVSLTVHAATHYRGGVNFNAPPDPTVIQPAYWNTEAGFSLQSPTRRWYIDAIETNISNAVVITGISLPPYGHIGPPRTFLINVGARL